MTDYCQIDGTPLQWSLVGVPVCPTCVKVIAAAIRTELASTPMPRVAPDRLRLSA